MPPANKKKITASTVRGDFNDLTLLGTLAGVEMSLEIAGVPHKKGGVAAAMEYLTAASARQAQPAQRAA